MPEKEQHISWYRSWFDTKYYHLLYKDRNDAEAAFFLDNLLAHLGLSPGEKIWDMACGKGRHVHYLAKKGFHAYGTDISFNSIEEAMRSKSGHAEFYVHDMRRPFRINYFDCVLNIFTSLGYFEHMRDDERIFISAFQSLKAGKPFVVDFLNAGKVLAGLVACEEKSAAGIVFRISKRPEGKTIVKTIRFTDEGKDFEYEERVKMWNRSDLERMGKAAGFAKCEAFGNYSLEKFDADRSDRLILVFEK